MKSWRQRPFEIRNLFNPAFCGLLLARTIGEYEKEANIGMPYSLTLLVLPLTLHKSSRDILSKSSKSYFLKVIERSPELLVGFPGRTRDLMPFTQEGFSLLANHGCLQISDAGSLSLVVDSVRKSVKGTDESRDCQKVAKYIGRQFARISDRATIYASLGVRP